MDAQAHHGRGRYWPGELSAANGYGTVTLAEALKHSMNTATIRLLKPGRRRKVRGWRLTRMGFTHVPKPEPSAGLGADEVNLLELTNAYAVIGQWRSRRSGPMRCCRLASLAEGKSRSISTSRRAQAADFRQPRYRESRQHDDAGRSIVGGTLVKRPDLSALPQRRRKPARLVRITAMRGSWATATDCDWRLDGATMTGRR